ncbi:putative transport protein [Halorubrum aidingense JCM 13560]|uniref:Putative transport protein n=1 Tax=Halorubrum aidingense JCM 13560 TaxID=1230454 RepID=M0PL12_9EURY|nr:SLC13 family permease [Halorubrum aidingense]EMA70766.1 putative transport protein [Halorubrum aidingense JCM 13560]
MTDVLRGLALSAPTLLQQLPVELPVSLDVVVVLAVVAVALALFVLQPVSIDTTAIALMVTLILLGPWTGVSPEEGVSGFSNPATLTVLSMFILSEGVRKTGVIQILTRKMESFAGESEFRQLLATVGLAGPSAGFVNNTPIVAILIPAVMNLARKTGTSPSKLLIPLSFASMMGGMLTVIGTSSNLLASDIWAQIGPTGEPFSLFEFTQLGAIVLAVGIGYLLTVGRYLTPARITAEGSPTDQFGMSDYLTAVVVHEDSDLVGSRVRELGRDDLDLDVFQIVRNGRTIVHGLPNERIGAGDILSVRASQETLEQVLEDEHLVLLPELRDAAADEDEPLPEGFLPAHHAWDRPPETGDASATADETDDDGDEDDEDDEDADDATAETSLTEVVLLPGPWSNRRDGVVGFERSFDATVLAIRRGDEVIRQRLRDVDPRAGDVLLVQTSPDALDRLQSNTNVVVSSDDRWEEFDRRQIPIALGIVAGVVGLAALEYLPIMVSALAGVVAMLFSGILRPADAYEAVDWNVIFLLAGVIPLGVAFEASGTADLIATGIVAGSVVLPPIAMLAAFYLGTAVITEMVSNNASIVLMLPIAVEVAGQLGVNAFAFALAVTFAASTPLLSPVGYQTNLMVYGPGGYKFTDFARVGAPLQLILTVVTTAGIAFFWGL